MGLDSFLPLDVAGMNEGLFDHRLDVLEAEGRVEGFVAFAPDEVTWLYVHPAKHRRGFGKALLDHALSEAGPVVFTEVLDGNGPATSLYYASGFTLVRKIAGQLSGSARFPATGLYLRRDRAN